jgi:hypothetical protein
MKPSRRREGRIGLPRRKPVRAPEPVPLPKERALEVECTRRKAQKREKLRQEKLQQEKLQQEKLQQEKLQQEKQHQSIDAVRRVPDHLRLAILWERDPKRARALFVKFAGAELQDRAIWEWFEQLVEQAIGAGDEQIELPIDLAEVVAILLKAVPTRGRRRMSEGKRIGEHTIYQMARADIEQLMDKKGLSQEEASSEVIRKTIRPELKRLLGKEDDAEATIRDRLQRRKPRTGK